MSPKTRSSAETTRFAKRVLVVDPDQKRWELLARLLIAQGHLVHRINHIKEAPPRWPQHLYDLVILATDEPERADTMEFCQKVSQVRPAVPVAFLTSGAGGYNVGGAAVLSRERPAADIAEDIGRLLG
jgi:CheY-like chemotaxis protein